MTAFQRQHVHSLRRTALIGGSRWTLTSKDRCLLSPLPDNDSSVDEEQLVEKVDSRVIDSTIGSNHKRKREIVPRLGLRRDTTGHRDTAGASRVERFLVRFLKVSSEICCRHR